MKISIIGTGYVGLVTGACLASKGHRVICLDVDEGKVENLKKGIVPIFEPGLEDLVKLGIKSRLLSFTTDKASASDSQVVFLCVGTPAKEDGSADLAYVFQAVDDITPHLQDQSVVVSKSTVPVGTGEEIGRKLKVTRGCSSSCHPCESRDPAIFVASNPEFLREGRAVEDFLNPDRIVIGSDSTDALAILKEVYRDFTCTILETSVKSAEMIKYASNAFLATKISFINEIANICEGVGADVKDVAKGMGLDPRIGQAFLNAGIGYGGSCFPKDVRALDQIAGMNGYDFKLLKAVIDVNTEQRWRFYNKILKNLNTPSSSPLAGGEARLDSPPFKGGARGGCKILKGLNIAILGLSFKEGTDDIRESIGIDYAHRLIKEGAQVSVYDEYAMENARKVLEGVKFAPSIKDAVKDADAVVITTGAEEFKNADWEDLGLLMKQKYIFDGRNTLRDLKLEEKDFKYFGVGC
ncbi:MAG: UDP-glucose/GDP-mannose dehydrogenase family protein [Patescibacteria group bacterium]